MTPGENPLGENEPKTDIRIWNRAMALLDLLLDSPDPAAVLAAEPDPEVRAAAERLWQHHNLASDEQFLRNAIEFESLPVLKPGQVLLNRFEIERLIGKGGMGEVYLARDRKLGEPVALKTISRLLADSPQIRRRFTAEVQNARRIAHTNVCRIHEIFDEGDLVFFVMEYVEGVPLPDFNASPVALEIAAQLAEGLHAAHTAGVVHGDFKPGNVLIVPGTPPRAVIMDFGLARRAFLLDAPPAATEEFAAGTRHYMAPELLAGSPPSIAADIFAFGKVAQKLLPKRGLLARRRFWETCIREHPGERPASLDRIVRTLRRDRTRRYWIAGSALAIAAAPLYSLLRSPQPVIRLEAGARLLVNGFQADTAAAPTARLLRALVITALQQSPRLHAISDLDLLPALRRLAPAPALPANGDLLKQLLNAQRVHYWVEGVLKQTNGRPFVSLALWRRSDGQILAQTSLGDAPAVTALAEQTALWIRRLAGESTRSLEENPAAVGAYTSSVPEALAKYYEAMEHYALGEMEAAIPLLQEASRLDPNFAQAVSARGMCLLSLQNHAEALACAEQGHSLAGNLPERERAWIETFYQEMVLNPVKMVETARANVDAHPDEPRFCRLFGQLLCRLGRASEGLPWLQKAVDLAPQNELLRNELALALCESGNFTEALTLSQQLAANSRNPNVKRGMGFALMGAGRYDEACTWFEQVRGNSHVFEAGAQVLSGKVELALIGLRQELIAQQVEGNDSTRHRVREFLCGACFLTDRLDLAREHVAAMLPLPECPTLGPQLEVTAFWAARTGDDPTLTVIADQAERVAKRWDNSATRAMLLHAQALRLWRRNDVRDAEDALIASYGSAFSIWTLFDLADFFTATGRPELADEYWKKFEDRRGIVLRRWFTGALLYGSLQHAIAARARGDRATASACASRVLEHWGQRQPTVRIVKLARQLAA